MKEFEGATKKEKLENEMRYILELLMKEPLELSEFYFDILEWGNRKLKGLKN